MKKTLLILLVIVSVFICGLAVARNIIVKQVAISVVRSLTGLTLQIQQVEIGIFQPTVTIRGVRLSNPAGFSDELMFDIPEAYVVYDPQGFLRREIHLPHLRLDLKELTVVRAAAGGMNVQSLSALKPKEGSGSKPPQLRIDLLELKIGTVTYKDYSSGTEPSIKKFVLNASERIEHVTDPGELGKYVVGRALFTAGISDALKGQVDGLGQEAGDKLKEAAEKALQKLDRKLTDIMGGE